MKGNFTSWAEQDSAIQTFKKRHQGLPIKINLPNDGQFKDHDRLIFWKLRNQSRDLYYKLILGQGLFGFESACRKRSHGVLYSITSQEFADASKQYSIT